jgi:hypothetical protein
MDWARVKTHWSEFYVWLEEYKLGRYRCDQKRILYHSRRSGGIQPPFDQRRGQYMEEWEYLEILEREREERFWRMNLWRKANVFRRFMTHTVFLFMIDTFNRVQDFVTRMIGRSTQIYRGYKWHRERRWVPDMLFAMARIPMSILIRWLSSFFLRLEFTRIWTLRDLDWVMQNKVSGELYAKYRFPQKYSISKYLIAIWEPILNTFNHFHAMRLVALNVFVPLFRRWWYHINDYKPYLGFVKLGILQWAIVIAMGSWTWIFTRFRYFEHASYAYKADFGHTYIALMTRAVYADILIALIEDGLVRVDPLGEGHDFEIHTRMKSDEYKYIDSEINRRCEEDPEYREQLRREGIPYTLDEFYGVENIPIHDTPKEQVLYILRQYTNYGQITREMLNQMKPLFEFTDKYIRVLYSLGLVSETTWLNRLMGNISSPRIFLQSYRALLNIIGTRDGVTDDPSVQDSAMIRALTRKFDLTILPPSPENVYKMKEFNRPYALQFLNTPWDKFAQQWEEKQYLHHKKYHDERPGMGLDLYHGADKTQYDPERHGEHQYYKNLPSVTNGSSDVNLKGLGKAFFDPYVAVLLPAYHERPLEFEMVVLQRIKADLIQLARISPEFEDKIPLEYDPYEYKNHIQGYLRVYGVNKLTTWEKMMGRDFIFETPDLQPSTIDVARRKHAKWLWSQVLACVTEKVEHNRFASPMYYIEDTCPSFEEENPYRSKVDTVNRFVFRNLIGRPITDQQRRARDYQLIDPFAEEHAMLFKRFHHDSRVYDFDNHFKNTDQRVERAYKTPGDDMGYWPGGKSMLPFLGVNKYRGTNPLTGFIGMLITSTENLMTVNRTANDIMIKRTDVQYGKPRYDPFGPQYRQNDGSYANKPEEDPRFMYNYELEDNHLQSDNKDMRDVPMSFTLGVKPFSLGDGLKDQNGEKIDEKYEPIIFKESEKEMLYRLQDSVPLSRQNIHGLRSQIDIAAADFLSAPHKGDSLRSQITKSVYKNAYQNEQNNEKYVIPNNASLSYQQSSYNTKTLSQYNADVGTDALSTMYNNLSQSQTLNDQNNIFHNNTQNNNKFMTEAHFASDMTPLIRKYNAALDKHLKDPNLYPNPLPQRKPYEKKRILHDSKNETDIFGD